MKLLHDYVWLGSAMQWLVAIGAAVLTAGAIRLLKAVLQSRIGPWAARTKSNFDNAFIDVVRRTKWFFYLGAGLYVGSRFLTLSDGARRVVNKAFMLVVLLQVGIWLHAFVVGAVRVWSRRHGGTDPNQQSTSAAALSMLLGLAVWSVVLLLALSNLGIEISALIAGLGIGGIAAALAVQNVLGDMFASMSIYFDRPFDIGDFIIVDAYMGTVDKIGMRSTQLRSLGGEQIILPNSDLRKSRIRNYRRMQRRRIEFRVGVEYHVPHEVLRSIPGLLKKAVESVPDTKFDRAHFKEFGDSALVFEVVYIVLSADYNRFMDLQQDILFTIHREFEASGVGFAFPTRTVHIEGDPFESKKRDGRENGGRQAVRPS